MTFRSPGRRMTAPLPHAEHLCQTPPLLLKSLGVFLKRQRPRVFVGLFVAEGLRCLSYDKLFDFDSERFYHSFVSFVPLGSCVNISNTICMFLRLVVLSSG